jgi:cell division protein FtsB
MTTRRATAQLDAGPLPPRRRERPWIRRALIFIACVVALDALVGERSFLQALRARKDLARVAAEVRELRRQNLELSRYVEQLGHDSRAIELMARDELGLIRRGEILVFVAETGR